MAEEVKQVHREPHPFIGVQQIMNFVGKPVAFVGRIDRFEENTMYMKTHEGKWQIFQFYANDGNYKFWRETNSFIYQ